MSKLLIVDDDKEIINSTTNFLNRSGYQVLSCQNGKDAFDLLSKEDDLDLVILDLVMPIMNGIEFCKELRNSDNKYKSIPIIMLTTLDDISDKFIGFEAGADDYLTKPFQQLELLLRIKSLLKRTIKKTEIESIDIEKDKNIITKIDKKNATLVINDNVINLTNTEFEIFSYLLTNTDKNVTTEEILEMVLGYHKGTGNPAVIRAHIKNIRNKIETNPSVPQILVNIQGRGYSINLEKIKI